MKAEKTRILVDSLLSRFLNKDNYMKNYAIIQSKLSAFNLEISELERLAEIGMMFERSIKNEMIFNKWQSVEHLRKQYEKYNNESEGNDEI